MMKYHAVPTPTDRTDLTDFVVLRETYWFYLFESNKNYSYEI